MSERDRILSIRQFTFAMPGGALIASADISPADAGVAPLGDRSGPTCRRRGCGSDYAPMPDLTVSTCGGTVVEEERDARGRVTAARFFAESGRATAVVDIVYDATGNAARLAWRAAGGAAEMAIAFFCDEAGRETGSETRVNGEITQRIRHAYHDNAQGDWIERRTYRELGDGGMIEVAVTVREIVYR